MQILHKIFSYICAVVVVVAGGIPATIPVFAENTSIYFESTNVLDDLQASTIEGEPFNLMEYGFNAKRETQVLTFVEYCYSYDPERQDNYGLYVYVYNPKGLYFDVASGLNTIQFAYGTSTSANYEKYPLRFLNCSAESNYERLFYKFKVVLTDTQKETILDFVNSTERYYKISGIELLTSGDINATDYAVAKTYRYSGYAAGYGSDENAESTIQVCVERLETLSLETHATQYRPSGTNGKNDYTQDSLHSVYFAVPNEYIEKYGEMSAVHETWLNAVLKPALVTGNQDAYEAIDPYLGVNVGTGTDDLEYAYLGAYFSGTSGTTGILQSITKAGYSYNRKFSPTYQLYGEPIETLHMLFLSDTKIDGADSYTVSSEEIQEQMQASKKKIRRYACERKV